MPGGIRLAGLTLRALLVQLMVAAPSGLEIFARLAREGQSPMGAWAVALAVGTLQTLGAPVVAGGFSLGITKSPQGAWAVGLASLPLAMIGGWHFSTLVQRPGAAMLGPVLALAAIFMLEGALGFALGRIARRAWARLRHREG